jgi:hypothetical protein
VGDGWEMMPMPILFAEPSSPRDIMVVDSRILKNFLEEFSRG